MSLISDCSFHRVFLITRLRCIQKLFSYVYYKWSERSQNESKTLSFLPWLSCLLGRLLWTAAAGCEFSIAVADSGVGAEILVGEFRDDLRDWATLPESMVSVGTANSPPEKYKSQIETKIRRRWLKRRTFVREKLFKRPVRFGDDDDISRLNSQKRFS